MAKRKRISRDKHEDLEEKASCKKNDQKLMSDKFKSYDESSNNVVFEPSITTSSELLADATSDAKQAQTLSQLQQSYGNTYVQQLVEKIQMEKGSGKPLEPNIRSEMEDSFNKDFGDVRVHTDAAANKLAKDSEATAFTSGKDIFFSDGAYKPPTQSGKNLLGHELAHVVQQESGNVDNRHNFKDSGDILEMEADIAGRQVVTGGKTNLKPAATASPVQLQKAASPGEKAPGEDQEPPKTTKDPMEIIGVLLKALKETETGKMAITNLKGSKTAGEGMIALSTLAVPALAVGFAEKMEVPQGVVDLIPRILKFELGKDMEIGLQPIYKGKLGEKPKEWGGMLTFSLKNW